MENSEGDFTKEYFHVNLEVYDANVDKYIDMLSDVNSYEDIDYRSYDVTNGKCGGYFTRIDKIDISCARDRAKKVSEFWYCQEVLVDCFEPILHENQEASEGETQ